MFCRTRRTWRLARNCCRFISTLRLFRPWIIPAAGLVRLQQILYLVEHHPEAAVSGSRAAYVYRSTGPNGGPYANVSDHEVVRDQWLAAVQGHPKNNAVITERREILGGGRPWRCRTGAAARPGRRSREPGDRREFGLPLCDADSSGSRDAASWNKVPTPSCWPRPEPRLRIWPRISSAVNGD